MSEKSKPVLALPRLYCPFCGMTSNEQTLLNDHLAAKHGISVADAGIVVNSILAGYRSAAQIYVESQASRFQRPPIAPAAADMVKPTELVLPAKKPQISPTSKG